ncbi:uncharacterized protein LOC130673160 [Microplitis mediator]|uniref:uncharacterized protein LOC130673160 n=1 Tax=Microplitis mediator TaxID=375433 RepID=UPI002552E990|nr:uncharacterized protein LOC130673160 [Microplitis mediator]
MKLLLIQFLLTLLSVNLVLGQGDPTTELKFTNVTITNVPNPYFGDWSAEILSPGDIVTIKSPVKKLIPLDIMMMGGVMEYEGVEFANFDILACDAFTDKAYGEDILKNGKPDGKFPNSCPVAPADYYEIYKYKVPKEKLPPGVPNGKFSGVITVYEKDKDPAYVKIEFDGTLSHKLPGVPGGLGIGG